MHYNNLAPSVISNNIVYYSFLDSIDYRCFINTQNYSAHNVYIDVWITPSANDEISMKSFYVHTWGEGDVQNIKNDKTLNFNINNSNDAWILETKWYQKIKLKP